MSPIQALWESECLKNDRGWCEVKKTVPRRGAVEHRYGPVAGRRWKAIRELLDVLEDA